jgi:hypothetical protein
MSAPAQNVRSYSGTDARRSSRIERTVPLYIMGTDKNGQHNVITNAQSGIFINGANDARITANLISNIDVYDGIDIQGTASGLFTNSRIDGNTIFNVVVLSIANESCGIAEFTGTFVSGNTISHTTVNDAYCPRRKTKSNREQNDSRQSLERKQRHDPLPGRKFGAIACRLKH